jgi:hypothetical protein
MSLSVVRAAAVCGSMLFSGGSQPSLADTCLQSIKAADYAFDFQKSGRVKPGPAMHKPDRYPLQAGPCA